MKYCRLYSVYITLNIHGNKNEIHACITDILCNNNIYSIYNLHKRTKFNFNKNIFQTKI